MALESAPGGGNALPDDPGGAFCRDTHVALEGAADGPLSGLRFAAKDIFDIKGHRTGFGNFRIIQASEIWANHGAWITAARPVFMSGAKRVRSRATVRVTESSTEIASAGDDAYRRDTG